MFLLSAEQSGFDGPEVEFVLWMVVTDADGDIRLIGFDVRSGKAVTTDKIADLDLTAGTARTVTGLRYRLVQDRSQ